MKLYEIQACWGLAITGQVVTKKKKKKKKKILAINSIEINTIQHRKKLVIKLLDYFSVRGGVIKPGFSEPGFQISALNFIF